jgi:hypothetical protein
MPRRLEFNLKIKGLLKNHLAKAHAVFSEVSNVDAMKI